MVIRERVPGLIGGDGVVARQPLTSKDIFLGRGTTLSLTNFGQQLQRTEILTKDANELLGRGDWASFILVQSEIKKTCIEMGVKEFQLRDLHGQFRKIIKEKEYMNLVDLYSTPVVDKDL